MRTSASLPIVIVCINCKGAARFGNNSRLPCSYELAGLRQMATTKIFLRNSDREIEYAADVVRRRAHACSVADGSALVHNANWGVHGVRPPYSKVFELPESQVRWVLRTPNRQAIALTGDARKVILAVIREYRPTQARPLNLSRAGELAEQTTNPGADQIAGTGWSHPDAHAARSWVTIRGSVTLMKKPVISP